MLQVDDTADIGSLRCPTRYLVASSESLRWQHLRIDQVLPGHIERIEIDGQHVLYLDQPERVAEEIDRFLSEREL